MPPWASRRRSERQHLLNARFGQMRLGSWRSSFRSWKLHSRLLRLLQMSSGKWLWLPRRPGEGLAADGGRRVPALLQGSESLPWTRPVTRRSQWAIPAFAIATVTESRALRSPAMIAKVLLAPARKSVRVKAVNLTLLLRSRRLLLRQLRWRRWRRNPRSLSMPSGWMVHQRLSARAMLRSQALLLGRRSPRSLSMPNGWRVLRPMRRRFQLLQIKQRPRVHRSPASLMRAPLRQP
mmetsp:Transcript_22542/g.49828  ORF Transcript_22542/g.49828 Transcript_22542/m.49828 type:complete len:236 (+) Transcript_22542:511-1218(+)